LKIGRKGKSSRRKTPKTNCQFISTFSTRFGWFPNQTGIIREAKREKITLKKKTNAPNENANSQRKKKPNQSKKKGGNFGGKPSNSVPPCKTESARMKSGPAESSGNQNSGQRPKTAPKKKQAVTTIKEERQTKRKGKKMIVTPPRRGSAKVSLRMKKKRKKRAFEGIKRGQGVADEDGATGELKGEGAKKNSDGWGGGSGGRGTKGMEREGAVSGGGGGLRGGGCGVGGGGWGGGGWGLGGGGEGGGGEADL